jgi:hypothetical protein
MIIGRISHTDALYHSSISIDIRKEWCAAENSVGLILHKTLAAPFGVDRNGSKVSSYNVGKPALYNVGKLALNLLEISDPASEQPDRDRER